MEYQMGQEVITPHGKGTIVDIESHDGSFNSVKYDDEKAVAWRYGIEHIKQPEGFSYNVLYYFPSELKPITEEKGE